MFSSTSCRLLFPFARRAWPLWILSRSFCFTPQQRSLSELVSTALPYIVTLLRHWSSNYLWEIFQFQVDICIPCFGAYPMTSFVNIREIQVYKKAIHKSRMFQKSSNYKKTVSKACIPQNITTVTENCQNEGYAVQKSNQNC